MTGTANRTARPRSPSAADGRKRTIYDVAARAGASASTVSAVLSGSWQDRRISADTARRVTLAATELGYSPNLQARGLRQARSGLVGMILPEHENRFFAQLAQAFSKQTRARGLLPAIISTRRDPQEEARSVSDLLSYATDALVVAGASDPAAISRLCRRAGLRHVFVDQPCEGAPSVVTDNAGGAKSLASALLEDVRRRGTSLPEARAFLVGGDARLPATAARIAGFREALRGAGMAAGPEQIVACGYAPANAGQALLNLRDRLGRLPDALLVNSITAFEGALPVLSALPENEVAACAVGCFDFSPFLSSLRFPVWMVRQRTGALMNAAFGVLDRPAGVPEPEGALHLVPAELVVPGHAGLGQKQGNGMERLTS